MSAFRAFARYRRPPGSAGAAPGSGAEASGAERCELCASALGPRHPHVADLEDQALRCSCGPCAILFRDAAAGAGRYRTVPDRIRVSPDGAVDEEAWRRLQVPVGLAFFFYRSSLRRWVACYPSPAGPTESELPDEAWDGFPAPALLTAVEPDVEALLLRRSRAGRTDCLLVPIDACYELVGVVRQRWEGFDGGDEARAAVDEHLAALTARARPLKDAERRGAGLAPPAAQGGPL